MEWLQRTEMERVLFIVETRYLIYDMRKQYVAK